MSNEMLYKYKNGDYLVTLFENGRKVRKNTGDGSFVEYPESIDLKITNYCDLANICTYCHERSDKDGEHADLDLISKKLKELPTGVELAIGGGNPLAHPNLKSFLTEMNNADIVCNLTINELHFKSNKNLIRELIEENLVSGIGVSYREGNFDIVDSVIKDYPHVTWHMILGVNTIKEFEELYEHYDDPSVLILGYIKTKSPRL